MWMQVKQHLIYGWLVLTLISHHFKVSPFICPGINTNETGHPLEARQEFFPLPDCSLEGAFFIFPILVSQWMVELACKDY